MSEERPVTAYKLPYFIAVVCGNCGTWNYIPLDAVDFDSHGFYECACDNCDGLLMFEEDPDSELVLAEGVTE